MKHSTCVVLVYCKRIIHQTRFHSRTREVLNDEGENEAFTTITIPLIVGSSVHTYTPYLARKHITGPQVFHWSH